MNTASAIRRLERRETHSSRAAASIVTALILAAAFLWLALELVLALLGADPLMVRPGAMAQWLVHVPEATVPAGLVAAGVVLALLGIVFLALAVKGGRRSRRTLKSGQAAIVVDDDVIAAAVSRRARLAGNLAPGQVTTTVGNGSVQVLVRPTSGLPADRSAIQQAVEDELAGYGLGRKLSPKVRISTEGALGQ